MEQGLEGCMRRKYIILNVVAASNDDIEIPRLGRGAHRLHQEQPLELRQHSINRLRERRC